MSHCCPKVPRATKPKKVSAQKVESLMQNDLQQASIKVSSLDAPGGASLSEARMLENLGTSFLILL